MSRGTTATPAPSTETVRMCLLIFIIRLGGDRIGQCLGAIRPSDRQNKWTRGERPGDRRHFTCHCDSTGTNRDLRGGIVKGNRDTPIHSDPPPSGVALTKFTGAASSVASSPPIIGEGIHVRDVPP